MNKVYTTFVTNNTTCIFWIKKIRKDVVQTIQNLTPWIGNFKQAYKVGKIVLTLSIIYVNLHIVM